MVLEDHTICSGSEDCTVRLWSAMGGGRCRATLTGHTARVNCLAVLKDGALASGARDGDVRLWV